MNKKFISVIILIIVAIAAGYYIWDSQNNKEDLNDLETVKEKISRHMLLPKDKTPALLTITDKSKVSSEFLKQAENGDKLLIYDTEQKVIIYRPSIDRIVDAGPVTIAASEQGSSQSE